MSSVLAIDNASFRYASAGVSTVEDISLAIEPGELCLLCGPSGCGKTTVTRLANGLVPHFYEGELSGNVSVCGTNVVEKELWEIARHVGSVFQNPKTQFYNVDVRGEVAFACENLGMPLTEIEERVGQAALAFHLNELLDCSLFELSGGQKQRVACASSTAANPQLIVLDEPSSNLDFHTMRHLREAIVRWKQAGAAILIAEHRLHYLEGLADQVLYMEEGRITRRFSGEEFAGLARDELTRMGLRTRHIQDVFRASGALERPALQRSGAPGTSASTSVEVSASTSTNDPVGASAETSTSTSANILAEASAKESAYVSNMTVTRRQNGKPTTIVNVDSLELPNGSIVALLGQNGAGKSTFAHALLGLNTCTGTLNFPGEAPLNKRQRTKQCYLVMQDVNHQLFCESVLDEVQLGNHTTEEEALKLLKALDLEHFAEEHPLALSGGQKQRVALASALASGRKLVIYDEPTSGLDLAHMQQVAATIQQAQTRGILQVVITHDPELILACCTHVAVMQDGGIIESYPLNSDTVSQLEQFFLPALKDDRHSSHDQSSATI